MAGLLVSDWLISQATGFSIGLLWNFEACIYFLVACIPLLPPQKQPERLAKTLWHTQQSSTAGFTCHMLPGYISAPLFSILTPQAGLHWLVGWLVALFGRGGAYGFTSVCSSHPSHLSHSPFEWDARSVPIGCAQAPYMGIGQQQRQEVEEGGSSEPAGGREMCDQWRIHETLPHLFLHPLLLKPN